MCITAAARDARPSERIDVDHVVPVVVLVERMLRGDPIKPVLEQSVLCVLTHEEHRTGGLEVALRTKQRELYVQMLHCNLTDLADLGWERYRRAGIEWVALG